MTARHVAATVPLTVALIAADAAHSGVMPIFMFVTGIVALHRFAAHTKE